MKILLTGCAGMLGTGIVPELVAQGHEVVATDLIGNGSSLWGDGGPACTKLDVRVRDDVERAIGEVEPDIVAHLAAETDLEISESDPDHAYLTNAIGTKHVALACKKAGIPIAYISTAGVFDGEKGDEPYTEYDAPNPINVYGNSKFEGERYVQWFCDQFYIVRAGWMTGGGTKDHKFVAKMLKQLNEGATALYAVGDKLGTPTYVPDFAKCFSHLITTDSYGLYHMACEGNGSRYDVTKKMLEVLGRTDVELVEVSSDYFKDTFPAPRPRSEMMRNLALDLQGWNTMRHWDAALDEYIRKNFM